MHIIPSPNDPFVVAIVALTVIVCALFIAGSTSDGRERTLRLLFLYLTYGALETLLKRGAHYAWYIYFIKYGLFGLVVLSWIQTRSLGRRGVATVPGGFVLTLYLGLAALQIFNPYQGNVIVGVLGWLSDFVFSVFYFVAFDLFDDVTAMRRLVRLAAIIGVLSAIVCFLEVWVGPNLLMKTYPSYVRFLYYAPNGIEYRPVGLAAFSEIMGIAALVGLIASRKLSVAAYLLLSAAIVLCIVANALHAVRIAWMTGFGFLAFFSVLGQKRRWVSLVLVTGSIALAVNISLTLTEGMIASSFASIVSPLRTFEQARLGGLRSILTIVPEFPLGVGVGESSAGMRLIDASGVTVFGVHNYIAELAAQMSLLGPVLLMAFCGSTVWRGLRAVGRMPVDERRTYACVAVSLFGSITVTFFGGGGLGAYPLNEFFWMMAGALMALAQPVRRPASVAAQPARALPRRGLLLVRPSRPDSRPSLTL